MLAPRAAATLGAFAALGCSGLLGIDDEQEDVVKMVCGCNGALPEIDGVSCDEYVKHRLEIAPPATRSAWMKAFDQACRESCNGTTCWNTMFAARPVCKDADDECEDGDCSECCNTTAGNTVCAGAP